MAPGQVRSSVLTSLTTPLSDILLLHSSPASWACLLSALLWCHLLALPLLCAPPGLDRWWLSSVCPRSPFSSACSSALAGAVTDNSQACPLSSARPPTMSAGSSSLTVLISAVAFTCSKYIHLNGSSLRHFLYISTASLQLNLAYCLGLPFPSSLPSSLCLF